MAICNKTRSPHKSFWEYAKKLLSVSLCLAVLSLGLPPRQSARVEAAEEKLSLPDTAFITKDKLLKLCEETNVVDGKPTGLLATGKLKEDGGTDVKLRINFGRRPEDAHYYKDRNLTKATAAAGPTTWLLAGSEKFTPEGGSEADGLVLYSEEPLVSAYELRGDSKMDSRFQVTENKVDYNAPANTGYGDSPITRSVFPDHWGASALRKTLQLVYSSDLSPYNAFFHASEKNLMSASTLRTDAHPPTDYYTTSDVLYAPYGVFQPSCDFAPPLLVGESSSLTLAAPYWGGVFWARPPRLRSSTYAWAACSGVFSAERVSDSAVAISAAFRLDSAPVLFASTASAASSSEGGKFEKISADTPMTLRLKAPEGSTAEVSATADGIVTKNAAGWTLMLQGVTTDGQNWNYSKAISSDDVVTVTTADVAGAGSIELENFDDCEVWLEKPVEDGGSLAYATQPVTVKQPIGTTVSVRGGLTQRIRLYDPFSVLPDDVEFSAKYSKLLAGTPNFIIQVGPVLHTYDLTLTSGGKELSQLDAPVTLRFEAVRGIDAADAAVTRLVNGASTDLEVSRVIDDDGTVWVEITTDHFSRYILVTGRRAARILLAGLAALLILALGFTIRFIRKKKKN